MFVVGIAQGGKLGHQVLQIQRNLAVCPIAALVDAILGDVFAFSGVHAEFGNDGKAHILQQPQLHRPGGKHRADIAVAYVLIEKRRSLLEQLRAAIVQAQRIFAVCAVGIDRFSLVPNGLQQGVIVNVFQKLVDLRFRVADETTQQWMKDAVAKGYANLLNEHYKDYASLFNRVKLELNPTVKIANLPTAQRLKNYRKGQPDYYLEKLYYQFGRYLLIASSRPGNMPANLQGIWHNNIDGPWRVDYHNNINIQMNYWPACSTNLDECMLPLIDFIRTLVKPGEKTAQSYFGARGWTASISANIFGFTTPLESQDMSWNFNPMAGPWLATHVWEYYDYTKDLKFLKETGYELIKSSANFTVDYLWHKPDGTYTAAPSTSPEHGPVDQGATFVHAVVREILLDAIQASKELGIDKKERKQWEHVLANLVPYKIGRYGQLLEWSTDIDDPKDEHRHVNHLFGLHPGHTVSPITTPELAEAAKVVLVHRGDGATGWSMGWKLNQWARLQDGNHAYTLFGNLLKNGTVDNLWDTHPPFQIDGNFGGTAGITEMLLQSHMGFIQLLPALPDAWKDGSIHGVCAKGNFEIDMIWKDGLLKEATLLSKAGQNCTVKYAGKTISFKTAKGRSYQLKYDKENGLTPIRQ